VQVNSGADRGEERKGQGWGGGGKEDTNHSAT